MKVPDLTQLVGLAACDIDAVTRDQILDEEDVNLRSQNDILDAGAAGDCLFWSLLALQKFTTGDTSPSYQADVNHLRTQITDFMRIESNKEDLKAIAQEEGVSLDANLWTTYIDKMSKPGEWATLVEVAAASAFFNKVIAVWLPQHHGVYRDTLMLKQVYYPTERSAPPPREPGNANKSSRKEAIRLAKMEFGPFWDLVHDGGGHWLWAKPLMKEGVVSPSATSSSSSSDPDDVMDSLVKRMRDLELMVCDGCGEGDDQAAKKQRCKTFISPQGWGVGKRRSLEQDDNPDTSDPRVMAARAAEQRLQAHSARKTSLKRRV